MRKIVLILITVAIAYCNGWGQLRVPSLQITDKLADTTFLYKTSVRTDTGYIYKQLNVGTWRVDSSSGRDSGHFARRDSARMLDLRLTAPVMIYLLSHNSFTDYVADEHIDWTGAADKRFSMVGNDVRQFYINSRGAYNGLLSVDCQHDRIGVGDTLPARMLDVNGDVVIRDSVVVGYSSAGSIDLSTRSAVIIDSTGIKLQTDGKDTTTIRDIGTEAVFSTNNDNFRFTKPVLAPTYLLLDTQQVISNNRTAIAYSGILVADRAYVSYADSVSGSRKRGLAGVCKADSLIVFSDTTAGTINAQIWRRQ